MTTTTNADPQLVPAARYCELDGSDPAALDRALYVLSGRQMLALATTEPVLIALAAGAPAEAGAVVADHIYAHVMELPVRGLPTPADRRERAPAHVLAPLRRALLRAGGPLAAQWPQPGRDHRPVLLHILHGWGGGADRFVRDLASTDSDRHHLLLRAVGNPSRRLHGEFLELSDPRGGPPLRRLLMSPAIGAIVDRHPGYRAALNALIADYCVEQIWVSSLIGHALEALRTGLPLRWIAHDYFPFWPALHRDFGAAQARRDPAELAADKGALRGGPFLVENSIKHGLDAVSAEVRITIDAQRKGDDLVLTVSDNGRGCTDVSKALAKGGIGLRNVRERLSLLHGHGGQFQVASEPGNGFRVVISIPFEQKERKRHEEHSHVGGR